MTIRKTPQYSNYQSGVLSALTARTIFTPASNTKGVRIVAGAAEVTGTSFSSGHFVMHTTSPSTMADGLTVSEPTNKTSIVAGGTTVAYVANSNILDDIFIPSGYGLYFICAQTITDNLITDVSYTDA